MIDMFAVGVVVIVASMLWTLGAVILFAAWPLRFHRYGFHTYMAYWPALLVGLLMYFADRLIHRMLNPRERIPRARWRR